MSIIIVFQSKHGSTEKAAWELQKRIDQDIYIHDLSKNKKINLHKADMVILGASIHAGKIQKRMRTLMETKKDQLLEKPLALYLCCMETGEKAREQFENNFPQPLREHAVATGLFGGAFDFTKMNFFEKSIVKKVAGVSESVSNFDENAIEKFSQTINAVLKGQPTD
ncbi:MAG: flavodoxin domain-containing protein [Bacteroidales bacterium]|nr:flavodoxin domain-containing protein [Bacteroidales bacterium]